MTTYKIALLPGDGIGQEVIAETKTVLEKLEKKFAFSFEFETANVGGTAYDESGTPLPEATLKLAQDADSVLLGAVGGPKWEPLDYSVRPERALLGLRAELGLFANLRPAVVFPALVDASALKREIVEGIDIMVVRELTGGIYFGKPRGIETLPDGQQKGVNTYTYTTHEIERIAKVAFELALKRGKKVTSIDKANVLETTELWRNVVSKVHKDYKGIELSHMYVDNCAMQLIRWPKQFDVIVTGNLFGDILSDEAAMLTGSIGMLPSASLNESSKGMYEPVHGSAPDIAGQSKANPIATILSAGMMLEYSFNEKEAAKDLKAAVQKVLDAGIRTADIQSPGCKLVSTKEMGKAICDQIAS